MLKDKPTASEYLRKYCYVDFFHPGKKWKRVQVSQTRKLAEKENNIDCFHTVQRFLNAEEVDGESYICPMFFDFDSDNLPSAHGDVIKLINWLMATFGLEENEMLVHFTGNRGFHVEIPYGVFVYVPWNKTHLALAEMASSIKHTLELHTLDCAIYSKRRQWRMPNTIHSKTGLYKVRLTLSEVFNLGESDIRKIAERMRSDDI